MKEERIIWVLHSILFKKCFIHFGWKQNEILFYDSFTHFLSFFSIFFVLCCFVYPFFLVKHRRRGALWRAFEKWIRKYFLKIGINSYLCCFVLFCLIAEILLLDEWRNKRTHWMFSWSIELYMSSNKIWNDFLKNYRRKVGSLYQRPIALNKNVKILKKSFFFLSFASIFLRFIIPEGT